VAELYEIQKGVPAPSSDKKQPGLTKLIREMECGDCIVIPGDKISSVHPCAAQAKAKVRTRKNPDGTVTVWRTDEPEIDEPAPVVPAVISGNSEWPKIEPTVADHELNLPEGYYFQAGLYAPRVWMQGKPPAKTAAGPGPAVAPRSTAESAAPKSIFD
jgi:hypothetical protein